MAEGPEPPTQLLSPASTVNIGETASFAVRLFGSCEVRTLGAPLPRLRSRRGYWLLALLALRAGRPVERSWLAGTLWPDSTEAQALVSLRQTLTDLRHALGTERERLVSPTARTLCLDTDDAFIDVIAFDNALKRGDNSSLLLAVNLHHKPLLDDCHEEWALPERLHREQACLTALLTLAGDASASGRNEDAAMLLRRVISADPYREDARRALMTALDRSGSPGEAVWVYRELRLLLQSELRTEPSAETRALYDRIREQVRQPADAAKTNTQAASTPAVSPPVTRNAGRLPKPLTELIGREYDIGQIGDCLFHSRLVSLVGMGGVGKTRLSIQVAEIWAEDQPDGVAFVDLAPLSDASQMERALANALGVQEEPRRPLIETLSGSLREKRFLLVLDNCEHLLDASAHLTARLLSDCPSLVILTTSRQALGVMGEMTWPVTPLSLPSDEEKRSAEAVCRSAAVRLFVDRASAVLPGFACSDQNAASIAEICVRLDGVPLALELAAARVRVLTPEQIALRLSDRFGLLSQGNRTALPRQQTLRALIDWSYDLLAEPERRLLARCSVFAGGWTLEAAATICADAGSDALWVLDALTGLVDQSLAQVVPGSGDERRYRLLETMRDYGRQKLEVSGDTENVKRRHRAWYLQFADHAEEGSRGPDQALWLNRLATEHDNVRAALQDYQAQGKERAEGVSDPGLHLANALRLFWDTRGYSREGREWLVSLLATEIGTMAERAAAYKNIGLLAMSEADMETATRVYAQSLALFREDNNRRGIADVLNNMGIVAWWQADYTGARTFYEDSLAIDRELNDIYSMAGVLGNLGLVAQCQADYDQARLYLEESLALRRSVGDQRGIANTLLNLGVVNVEDEHPDAASSYCEESLSLFHELGQKDGIAVSLTYLGCLALQQGLMERSQALHDEALGLFQELGDKRRIADTFGYLADISLAAENYQRARFLYREQFQLRAKLGEKRLLAASFEGLFRLAAAQKQETRAVRLCSAADALRAAIGSPLPRAERLKHQEAIDSLRESLGEAIFATEWAVGQDMTLEETTEYALREEPVSRLSRAKHSDNE